MAENDLHDNPFYGRPLPRRLRLSAPTVDSYLAAAAGPPPHLARMAAIEDAIARHARQLERAWRTLAAACDGDGEAFASRWRSAVDRWSFGAANDLIEKHNRYYPAEARLPMNPRTGDFELVDGQPYRRPPLDAAWALARFPAVLSAVQAGEEDRRERVTT